MYCRAPSKAGPGQSQVGDSPFRRSIEAALSHLDWPPLHALLRALGAVVIAPAAAWVWACSGVAVVLTFALSAIYSVLPRELDSGPIDPVFLAAAALLLGLRIATLPFVYRSVRNAAKMSAIQPAVRRLQQEHGHDRERLAQATMALYRDSGTNPLAGCLSMIPVILAFGGLWGLLSGLTIRSASGTFAPNHVGPSSALGQHMAEQHYFVSLRMDLTATLPELGICLELWPYYLAIVLLGATQFPLLSGIVHSHTYGKQIALLFVFPMLWLPIFFVQLRVIDNLYMIGQQRALRRIRDGLDEKFRSDPQLQAAVIDLIQDYVDGPKPPSWQHGPDDIPPPLSGRR